MIQLVSRRDEAVQPLAAWPTASAGPARAQGPGAHAGQQAEQIAADLRKGRSLEEAGRPAGLTVQKSAAFARETPPPIASRSSAKACTLAKGAVHPEPFGLARGAAFIKVEDVEASRLPELAEVKDRVRADLVERRALERAAERAQQLRQRAARRRASPRPRPRWA